MNKTYFLQPVMFPEVNKTYAADQPEYQPLPVHKTPKGTVTSCWEMKSIRERIRFLFSGKLFVSTMTFNQPLQPLLVTTEFHKEEE